MFWPGSMAAALAEEAAEACTAMECDWKQAGKLHL